MSNNADGRDGTALCILIWCMIPFLVAFALMLAVLDLILDFGDNIARR
jgi:hypothetical protein